MNKFISKLTIKTKVVISTIITVSSVIASVGIYSFNSSWDVLLDKTFNNELPAILGEVNNDLNAQLEAPIIASKAMAVSPLFTQYQDDTSEEYITRYLIDIKNQFNAINTYFVSNKDGKYYIPEGVLRTMSKDNPEDQWFYGILQNEQPYSFNFDTDSSNGVPTMFVNYEIIVNGKKTGIAGLGLTLESVSKIIKDYKIGDTGLVFLVDNNGIIKIHPNKSMIGKNISTFNGLDKSLLGRNDTVIKESNINGDDKVFGAKKIESLGWTLVAEIPKKEALADLNGFGTTLFIISLVIAAIFIPLTTFTVRKMLQPLEDVATLLENIGKDGGDLTKRLDDSKNDEIGRISKGYNEFVTTISELLKEVSKTQEEMTDTISGLNVVSKTMESDVKSQTAQIEQVATAIHEMGASSQDIAENSNSAATSSQDATASLEIGNTSVLSTAASVGEMDEQLKNTQNLVNQLSEDAQSINKVLSVISGVSEQTNLLALNAAIEAARAGDAGRGFAVVADEVRTLASRSNESASEISDIIDKLQNRTRAVVDAINTNTMLAENCKEESKNSEIQLSNISSNISHMNDINMQIASATTQQSNVVSEISPHITEIAEIARSIDVIAEGTTEECESLLKQSEELSILVSKFKF